MKVIFSLTTAFLLLFIGTNFVNKYVLSILRFTYPTIFQGWQSLVGIIMFRALLTTGHVDTLMTGKQWHDCALWLPGMVCFLLSMYSGSRALANLPIPVFFAMQNIILLFKALADIILNKQTVSVYNYAMLMSSILSALAVARTDPQFHPEGYMWMCVHVISLGAFDFYTNMIRGRLKLSVIVLAPSSYFLGDALEAQRFPYWYFAKFYVGCIMSGVLGMLMNLCAIRLHEVSSSTNSVIDIACAQAAAKIFCSSASVLFYDIKLSNTFTFFLIVNQLCSFGYSESSSLQRVTLSLGSNVEAMEDKLHSVDSGNGHSLKRHELQQDLIRGEIV